MRREKFHARIISAPRRSLTRRAIDADETLAQQCRADVLALEGINIGDDSPSISALFDITQPDAGVRHLGKPRAASLIQVSGESAGIAVFALRGIDSPQPNAPTDIGMRPNRDISAQGVAIDDINDLGIIRTRENITGSDWRGRRDQQYGTDHKEKNAQEHDF